MSINVNKPIEVRDLRNGSWFWIQTHVWRDKRLKSSDRITYATVASYANQYQETYPSITKIAADGGLSERQVYTCIKRLEQHGYLQIDRKLGGHNVYKLLKTYPAPESELREHTPEMVAPLQESHPTPAKSTVGTPAKNGVRTISNITRSNILPKGNGDATPQEYGNKQVNQLMEVFEKKWGYKPTDRYPRQQAWLLVQAMNKTIKSYGKTPDDVLWSRLATKYFDWIDGQVWGEGVQTLSLIRLKYPIFESKIKGQA